MTTPIISASELDYRDEYDPMHEVYYRNNSFTGTAQDRNEIVDYVNGMAHGRYVARFSSGTLRDEGTYVNGERSAMTSWHEDGTLRETFRAEGVHTKKWDRDGILAYQAGEEATEGYQTRWFYKNGTVKQHTTKQGTDYFAPDGRLAMRVTYRKSLNLVKYVPDVLKVSYVAVLTNYFAEASQERSSVEWYFWGWVWQLLKERHNRPTAMAILNHLRDEQFDTARQILINIKTLDLNTFQPSMSYQIEF